MTTDAPRPESEEPPVMPTADEAAAENPPRQAPGPVRYAFVVWVLAGLVGVANGVLLLINKQRLIDTAIENNRNPNITNEQIANGTITLLWVFMIGAVIFAAFFTLFAYKAQEGVRRARLLLTVLCVITVVFYFLILPTTLGLMAALLSLAATVMLYLPRAGEYFRPREE